MYMKSLIKTKGVIALLLVLCCLVFPLLAACGRAPAGKKMPAAVNGIIDLSGWDFKRDGYVRLDGQWEFYWDRLLEPSDFLKEDHQKDRGFITVPGLWKGHEVNGLSLPGSGRATYRLKIISGSDKKLSLTIHRIFSVYKLWINGILADKKGTINGLPKSREDYIFIHNKRLSSFTLNEDMNEIILQVINYDYKSGGIDRALRLDDGEAAAQKEFRRYTVDMIVVGLLLFAFIYNILFYFSRKTDAAPLYIGFASLAWAVNTYNIQSPILYGSLSYPANPFLINYISVILGTSLCVMIIRSLFPDEFSMGVIRLIQVSAAASVVPLFFTGFRTAEQIMKVYLIFILLIVVYNTYVFIKAVRNRRDDSMFFFIGFLFLFAGGINNILYALWIIDTGNAIHYSMTVFCVTATMVVSRRFSRAFRMVEELSGDLEEKNITLVKMEQIKDQFLANTSHELRTPLHGMIGLSESMVDGSAGSLPPKAIENLSLIASSGHRLSNMVNDLLDMAKIQDEGLSLNLRPVDLYALSEMVVRLSHPLLGGKPVEIINNIPPDVPRVRADEDRIRQVMHNLIDNAIKFTSKGKIVMSAAVISPADENGARNGAAVETRISDTGIGVPEEYREKIFEAYQQADGSDTRSYGGTGLGLAIAKKIVELHEGSIRVEPGNEGGSVFSFTLPVSDDALTEVPAEYIIIEKLEDSLPANDAHGHAALSSPANGVAFEDSPVILVVDDDPVNVRVVQNFFE